MKLMSVIIPCFNEGATLGTTYVELKKVLDEMQLIKKISYEILFVNDGSRDETLEIIKELSKIDPTVKYISLSRNFGKESGMLAGLEKSRGDIVVILDADLQHPPSMIKHMVDEYENGFDQVIAKRNRKNERFIRKVMTKLYYKIVNKIMDVELVDGVGDFRLLSRRAVQSIIEMPEYNRFSKGIFSWIGYEKKVINYDNHERLAGESKWSISSLLNYAIDGIISFNSKPLRLLIYLGLFIMLINFIYIGYSFIDIFIFGIEMPGYFTLISAVMILGGIQLLSIGILGEYIGKIFNEVKSRPKYIVQETNVEKVDQKVG